MQHRSAAWLARLGSHPPACCSSPAAPSDAELFGARLPKTAIFSGPLGRAVQIANGRLRLIQIANAIDGATQFRRSDLALHQA